MYIIQTSSKFRKPADLNPQLIRDLAFKGVDPVHGFLPAEEPLECLPAGFEAWERIAAEVPALLMVSKLRPTLEKLRPPDLSRLENEQQLRRAMLLLSVFGNAYVWGGEKPATTIPQGIALPWWEIAEKLRRPPIAAYASIVLDNWRRLEPDKPVELDNIATLQLFLGGLDERWFYLTCVAIEAKGGPVLRTLVEAQKAVVEKRVEFLAGQIKKIADLLVEMHGILLRISEKCDPYIYYHRVRPFLAGWPELGVIYEGVSEKPQKFVGASAAQSSLIQSLDAGLGIKHQREETQSFLQGMRSYMPPKHRQFIAALEAGPSLRQFVLSSQQNYPTLCDFYNDCIRNLNNFRKTHSSIAANYILRQAPQQTRGTGGTNFVHFLKTVEKETKANLIARSPLDTKSIDEGPGCLLRKQ